MGFSYNPGIAYHGDQYIAQAGNAISEDLRKAIDTYKQDQQQEAFSNELMHHLAQTPSDPTDPTSAPIVPIDKLNEFQNAPLKKKVGMAMAAQSTAASTAADAFKRATLNLAQQKMGLEQSKFKEDTQPFTISDEDRQNLRNAGYEAAEVMPGKYQLVPYGGANGGDNFEPDPAKVEEMRQAGRIWAPMGPHQGQWVDDPNSWVNSQQLTPIKDPRDATGQKIVGFQQPNGSVRYFPSTNMADAIAALTQKAGASPTVMPSATPGATQAVGGQPVGTTASTPAPTAAPTATPPMTAANAPEGAYARRGTQWFQKVNGQWVPSGEPVAR